MLAAKGGHVPCCQLLVKFGAVKDAKHPGSGLDAQTMAQRSKRSAVVKWFKSGCKEEDSEEEDTRDSLNLEGESNTARNKRLKRERAAKEAGLKNKARRTTAALPPDGWRVGDT